MLLLSWLCCLLLAQHTVLADTVVLDDEFNMEWSVLTGRMHQRPKCVDIPGNMTLCHKIGYERMRLPNLLEHDNLKEATQQADNWKSLLGIRCHPDTQVFLCSLFSPICLDRVVYPCRSLCEGVRQGCESYMKRYGFSWPEMFRCNKFPTDDDLCIPAPSRTDDKTTDSRICPPCQEPDTYEGILHNHCRANFVIRAKVRGLVKNSTTAGLGEIELNMGKGNKKFYKRDKDVRKKVYKALQDSNAKIYIEQGIGCTCNQRIVKNAHHLMAITKTEKYDTSGQKVIKFYAAFITPWRDTQAKGKSSTKRSIKLAIRAIRKNDNICAGGITTLNIHHDGGDTGKRRESRRKQKVRV